MQVQFFGSVAAVSAQRWWLDDAEARNRDHPTSFFIPPRTRREALVTGDQVKLVFCFEPAERVSAERMWVDVEEVTAAGYVGRLLDQPEHIHELAEGARVEFGPQHVASVAVTEEEVGYRVEDWAVVSRRIRDEDAWPYFVYRHPPHPDDEREGASGWQLWAHGDDDEFVDDPANVVFWELGWIADKFPPIEELLRSGVEQGEWWWDEDRSEYRRRV